MAGSEWTEDERMDEKVCVPQECLAPLDPVSGIPLSGNERVERGREVGGFRVHS